MSNAKKVAIMVVCTIAAIAVVITGIVLIGNYFKNKPERKVQAFREQLLGEWNGNYEISSLNFDQDDTVSLKVLGVNIGGTYGISYITESKTFVLNLEYHSSLGLSVNRDFDAKIDEVSQTLTLHDKESGLNLTYKKDGGSLESAAGSVSESEAASLPSVTFSNASEPQQTEKADPDFKDALIGKWENSAESGGYTFFDDGTVSISLASLSASGTYTVSKDENGTRLKISYKTMLGAGISNSYYAEIENDCLKLTQIGMDSLVTKYTKVY